MGYPATEYWEYHNAADQYCRLRGLDPDEHWPAVAKELRDHALKNWALRHFGPDKGK